MAAKKVTLEMKKTTCLICTNSDKRALRQHRPYCQSKKIRHMVNGHCSEFETIKPRFLAQRIGHPSQTSRKWTGDCPNCSYIATGTTKKAVMEELERHYNESHRR